jgi:hypothetical protein
MKKNLFLAVTAIMFGCSNDQFNQEPDQIKTKEATTHARIGPSYLVQTIFAGQNIDAGYVEISNDGTNFEVEYFATGNWKFSELHLYVGDLIGAPTTGSGNPIPGRFDNKITFSTPVTSYSFVIPISSINLTKACIIVAAHSKMKLYNSSGNVVRQETGWAGLEPFSGANWATYSNYCLSTSSGGDGSSL